MVGLLLALVGPLQDASSADVERKLSAMRISIEFSGAPLGEAVDFVREASGLNIVVDPRVDKRAGVTMQVKGVTLKSALNLILKPLEAGYVISEGIVRIVPAEELKVRVTLRIYDLGDLTMPLTEFPGGDLHIREDGIVIGPPEMSMGGADMEGFLEEVFQSFTGRAAWDDNSNASILIQNGILIVRQTREVHAKLEKLLGMLRRF